nr:MULTISPECIES: chemotaxis protein CheA [unclassified Halomonas]
MLQQFLQESREALESIGNTLLTMERNPGDLASLDELFRLVHTLKGNSGLFDFPALTSVLHAAEDVMDSVRTGALTFNQTLADQLLDTADYVNAFLDEVERREQPGDAFQMPPQELITGLRHWLAPTSTPESDVSAEDISPWVPSLLNELPEEVAQQLDDALRDGQSVYAVDYRPASECFFQGTDPLHLVRQLDGVLWRRVTPCQPWPPLGELDAYECRLRFEFLVLSSESQLNEHFRYVSDQVAYQAVTSAPREPDEKRSVPLRTANALTIVLTGIEPLALDIIRTQQAALLACLGQPWLSGQQAAIIRTLRSVLSRQASPEAFLTLKHVTEQAQAHSSAEPILNWLTEQFDALAELKLGLAQDKNTCETESAALSASSGEAQANVSVAAPAMAATAERPNASVDRTATRRQDEAVTSATPKVLKIEQEKIDRLMNLIGEIVVAKNGLPYLAERAESQYAQRELAREIKAQYAVVNRIAEDLQDAIMQVRMMPVSFVLQRFPRLVRDISRKLGKKVNLVLEGEDTEADKSMIEALADPLVHIIRNALDHGLELPDERVDAGKPDVGTLRIRASQNADHVMITIEDDGRGIDPQKIKSKVASKALVDVASLEAMGDQELINLVFLPGFSTAEQISDLSGRGVGMDVVRSGIEKVGGQLRLASQPGKGTQLSLSLPLSMAVTQVMVIESAGQRFGIPMDQVMETVRLPQQAIHTIKQQPTAQLRGRTIPLKSLNQLLACDMEQLVNDDDEYALMVLRSRGELVGLLIDDFHGSNDIILKPMVGILGELSGYSGTAVMGDGSILMILNPTELFE